FLGMACGCGGVSNSGGGGPVPAPFSLQLASATVAVFPNEGTAQVGITITRTASTATLTASVSGVPAGATATVTSPGTGDSGSITFASGSAAAGSYSLTVSVTDGTNTFTQPLTLTVGVTAVVSSTAAGTWDEAMSTSFQIAEWTNGFFQQYPGSGSTPSAATLLGNLEPQHVRMQILSQAIPETAANTWDFTMADNQVQPILGEGDHSPEFQIATAPAFMYVSGTQQFTDPTFAQFAAYAANLVRYYNKGGFTVGGTLYQSASSYPITWWGIYNEPNINGVTPAEYVTMYNALVPAMQAVDPSLKFVAVELSDFGTEEQDFIPTFVQGVTAQVDVLGTHFYSTCNQQTTDAEVMATIPTFVSGVEYLYSELKTNPALANVPVWILENNVNADYADANGMSTCNPGQKFVDDLRGSSAFFAGWRTYEYSQLGQAGAHALYQWSFDGDAQYGEFNSGTGQLQLSYWVDYWLSHTFAAAGGGSILSVTDSDANNVEVLAVKETNGQTVVMVSDHGVANANDNNGVGVPRTVLVDVSALGSFTSATEVTIDKNTSPTAGPVAQTVAPAGQMQVTLGGYGVAFLTLQ
ncbi:MAG: hypothetical protein WA634_20280, partial [Silvibacterium sp.]